MTPEQWQLLASLVLLTAFVDGALSSRELVAIHRSETAPRSAITRAFALVAIAITLFAGLLGFLALRRALGFEAFPGASIVTLAVSLAVLFIPRLLRRTVQQIRRTNGDDAT